MKTDHIVINYKTKQKNNFFTIFFMMRILFLKYWGKIFKPISRDSKVVAKTSVCLINAN